MPLAGAGVVGGDVLHPRPFAHPVAGGVAGFRGELAVVDVDDQVPAAARVEAERDALVGAADSALAEGVLELVAVAPLFDGADDRLHLEVVEPADPPQRVLDLGLLLGQLALVGEALPGRARAGLAAVDAAVRRGGRRRRAAARSSRASAKRFLPFVTSARTRSPGSPPATKTTKPSARATPRPPKASESISTSSRSPLRGARVRRRVGLRSRTPLAGEFPARLADEFLQLGDQRVGLFAAAFEQLADHLLGVPVGHPAAFDRVVDDLLDAVPAQRDAVLERVTKLGEAFVDPDRFRFGFRRRFFRSGFRFARRFFRFRFRRFFGRGFFRLCAFFAAGFFGARRFLPKLFSLSVFSRSVFCPGSRQPSSRPFCHRFRVWDCLPTLRISQFASAGGSCAAKRASTGA